MDKDKLNAYHVCALTLVSGGDQELGTLKKLVERAKSEGFDAEKIFNYPDASGGNVLFSLPGKDGSETLEYLLDRGADPRHRDDFGRQPVHVVNNIGYFDALVASGADPDAVVVRARKEDNMRSEGDTPLHIACRLTQSETAFHLLQLGADLEKRDGNGKTPLFIVLDEINKGAGDRAGANVVCLFKYLLEKTRVENFARIAGKLIEETSGKSYLNKYVKQKAAFNALNAELPVEQREIFKSLFVDKERYGDKAFIMAERNIKELSGKYKPYELENEIEKKKGRGRNV